MPADDIVNFNANTRNQWVADKARLIPPGSIVLDAGAGECQYRRLFAHCNYQSQDFARYTGTKSGLLTENWNYGKIDYECDITQIPVADGSFDVVLCTEVLEHVPYPIETLQELARVLAPGGKLLLTAPLASGIHQQPYHYYGGYSPYFYKKFLPEFGLTISEITPVGGLLKHVSQEVSRVGRALKERYPDKLSLLLEYILLCWLPTYLSQHDNSLFVEEFTVGYLVEAHKPFSSSTVER